MKVFVSWSGELSHKVALVFREWLPLVIQSVKPYVSSEDIQKGARWSPDIESALSDAKFGIICLTNSNLDSPWLNFESGALSQIVEDSKRNVCPFLFNVKRSSIEGPLTQFQNVENKKEDVFKMLSDMNTIQEEDRRLADKFLATGFDTYWPEFQRQLSELKDESVPIKKRDAAEVLEEMVEVLRGQQRILPAKLDEIISRLNTIFPQLSFSTQPITGALLSDLGEKGAVFSKGGIILRNVWQTSGDKQRDKEKS